MKEDEFKEKLEQIYPYNYDEVLRIHHALPNKSYRVNTLKISKENLEKLLFVQNFEFQEAEFPNFYILKDSNQNKKLTESDIFTENKIYIQELSSAIPAIVLDPKSNEKILDMCASPGSKTSQIQMMTSNSADLVAVEKDKNRFFKMREILNAQGVNKVRLIKEDANYLPKKYPQFVNYFDKILLDAPCTNEASIDLNSHTSLKYWSSSNARNISKLQKGLINTALRMLKVGGILVYSTCTYSFEENEMVVNWLLARNDNIELMDINLDLPNIEPGIIMWNERELDKKILKTKRIIPNNHFKGFFVAKIRKFRK